MPPAQPSQLFATQIAEARYYYPGLPRAAPRGVAVVCAGWEICRADYELDRRTFPWVVVELVVRGQGELEIDGRRYLLRPGALFCYGPTTSLRITSNPEHSFLKYFVGFSGPEVYWVIARGALWWGEARQAVYSHEL